MDIARSGIARRRRNRMILGGAAVVILMVTITAGVSRLERAAPAVDRDTLWIDTVRRGPMVRTVRGPGTLVPEEIRWIPAATEGRVERILVLPGSEVAADTVLIELSNPELELAAREAASQVEAAEAEYTNLGIQLESQLLAQQAAAAAIRSEQRQAALQEEVNVKLAEDGLIGTLTLTLSQVRARELTERSVIEDRRLEILSKANDAQLAVQRARLDHLRANYRLRLEQVDSLRVRPGTHGVLQQLSAEVGQQVTPGTNLARVAEPDRLKAEIRIAETQARDVQIGQKVSVDTRNGLIPAEVSRVDPAVQNGTVTVDARLEGPLPRGARPDLSIDGTIELERLPDVLYVGRPAYGQESSTVGLFRIDGEGDEAVRVPVQLGRMSVSEVEIVSGLNEGDRIVLSDMSGWDEFDRVRLD